MRISKNKSIVLLMAMFLIFCCACGSKNDVSEESKTPNSESTQLTSQIEEKEEEKEELGEDSILVGTYKVPLKEMYIDIPDMHYIENGYTKAWFEDQVKYATFTFLRDEIAEDEMKAFELTFESFKKNMTAGLHTVNGLGEITAESTTINGINVYSFEGVVNCGTNPAYDAYVRGYSFIYDEMPCSIIGVVMDEEQPQDQIDAIKEIVDAMILTVRSKQ